MGVAENWSFITEMEVTEAKTKLNHYDLIGPINTVSWESWVINYVFPIEGKYLITLMWQDRNMVVEA